MKRRTLFALFLFSFVLLPAGRASTTDPIQARTYRFVSIDAEDAKAEIDRVLSSLGSREASRQTDSKTITITDRVTRLMQIDEIIPLLDQPLTQTLPTRRRMELRMRLSQHYAAKRKDMEAAGMLDRKTTFKPEMLLARPAVAVAATGPLGVSTPSGIPEEVSGPEMENMGAAMTVMLGLRLRGIIEDERGERVALLYQDSSPYTLKRGLLYELGRYPVKGISGVIRRDKVELQVPRRKPVVLSLYEKDL